MEGAPGAATGSRPARPPRCPTGRTWETTSHLLQHHPTRSERCWDEMCLQPNFWFCLPAPPATGALFLPLPSFPPHLFNTLTSPLTFVDVPSSVCGAFVRPQQTRYHSKVSQSKYEHCNRSTGLQMWRSD